MQNNERNIAIKVNSLSKIYPLYNSPKDRLKEALHPKRKKYHKEFYALKDISFEVNKGDSLGIIGQNGSGKSTLLKILSKVLTPSAGTFDVKGRVVSLLELGSGFNPELTGIENIYFYGTILGFSKKKIEEKLDGIISYADIGQFINQPLKTYSSGMRARLGFAVASHVDPDILILDEVLAVGDIRFKQKCLRTMKDIIDQKRTVLFVSHDTGAIINFCNNVLWLNEGRIIEHGASNEIVKKYVSYMTYGMETKKPAKRLAEENKLDKHLEDTDNKAEKKNELSLENIKWINTSEFESFGEYGGIIEKVALYFRDTNKKVDTVKGGEWLSFYTKVKICENVISPGLGIKFKDKMGNGVFTVNNYIYEKTLDALTPGENVVIRTDFKMPLLVEGKYPVSIAFADGSQANHVQHHWIHDALIVIVNNPDPKFKRGDNKIVIESNQYNIKGFIC